MSAEQRRQTASTALARADEFRWPANVFNTITQLQTAIGPQK